MTYGDNIVHKKPRILKHVNNDAQIQHTRYLGRINRTWMFIDKHRRMTTQKHVHQKLHLPIDPINPLRKNYLR